MRPDSAAATRTAAVVGRFFALLVGALGLVANPFLILIAIFIWQGGSAEAQRTEQRIALRGITVRQAMISRFASLAPDDHLGHAADGILAGFQEDFPVLEDGRVVGLLPRADLVRALARFGPHAPVSIGMRTEFPSAEASEPLEGVVARMGESATGSVPVLDSGRLVGMLTLENVGELLMIRRAEREARALAAT
jgi:CBS domain-containing protein